MFNVIEKPTYTNVLKLYNKALEKQRNIANMPYYEIFDSRVEQLKDMVSASMVASRILNYMIKNYNHLI